jgi:hypothetical protein
MIAQSKDTLIGVLLINVFKADRSIVITKLFHLREQGHQFIHDLDGGIGLYLIGGEPRLISAHCVLRGRWEIPVTTVSQRDRERAGER